MVIFFPKERDASEPRTAVSPESAGQLKALGLAVYVEKGAGLSSGFTDTDYKKSGAVLTGSRHTLITTADIIARVSPPRLADVRLLKKGACHISFFDPFANKAVVAACKKAGISLISLELIPRLTLSQKMDALSSQANLAGYTAVIAAAEKLNKIFPMMMTAAGTISPARVFVIGAGVAGLQAIATAKRLGARVEAFDTRPVVAEQVASLGAKFVSIDIGSTGQTKDGYAKKLTASQLAAQRKAMADVCARSDIVITTAQVFGRRAPRIITKPMILKMKPASVIVDLAASSGGNVEGSKCDKEVVINGVHILAFGNFPGRTAANASAMLANNISHLITHYWKDNFLVLEPDDEILHGCLVTHQGQIFSKTYLDYLKKG